MVKCPVRWNSCNCLSVKEFVHIDLFSLQSNCQLGLAVRSLLLVIELFALFQHCTRHTWCQFLAGVVGEGVLVFVVGCSAFLLM